MGFEVLGLRPDGGQCAMGTWVGSPYW